MANKEQTTDQETYMPSGLRMVRQAIFNTLESEAYETAHDGLRVNVKKDQKWGVKLAGVKFKAVRLTVYLVEPEDKNKNKDQTVVVIATLKPNKHLDGLPDAKIRIKVVYSEVRGRETVKATLRTSNQKHLGEQGREKRKEWLSEASEMLVKKFEEPERAEKLLQLAKSKLVFSDE